MAGSMYFAPTMLFEFNLYSSLLLVFFVHGSVYALLLYKKGIRQVRPPDKFLSLFLLLCVLYIMPWMLGFAGWYNALPYRDILFYVPFQMLFFIGPVLFFFVQSLLNPGFKFSKNQGLHLLPGTLYLFYAVLMLLTDKLILRRPYFLSDGSDRDFDGWYQTSGFLSMLVYLLLSLRYYNIYRKLVYQVTSFAETVLFRWLHRFLAAFLLMLLLQLAFFILSFFIETNYWSSWWYYLSFALIFYYIAIAGYANSVETKIAFQLHFRDDRRVLLLSSSGVIEDGKDEKQEELIEVEEAVVAVTSDEEPDLENWKVNLQRIIEQHALYKDPNLTLPALARRLGSNASFTSKIINTGFGMNFNDFVNMYRVRAVVQQIDAGLHQQHTLLAIATENGFNSKATFNRAFKKAIGKTPTEYIELVR